MIQISQLSLHRGAQVLLEDADLTLYPGWKIGIIGANGVGKSSLFKLLLGQLEADAGHLEIQPNLTIAHMAQEVTATDRTIIDYVLDGDRALREIQAKIADAETNDRPELLGELHAELDAIQGYSAKARAEQLLVGLGFANGDFERSVKSLSGGWRIRLNLAQALMCRSDILLLDEPTNHLDLDATLWLEEWLRQYPGMLLLISHDRDFLDQVVSHVTHMYQQKLTLYKGNYSAFERARAERLAQQQVQYEKQQQRIAEIEQFVRRFKAKASKAKQAQSRVKELERMEMISAAHIESPFTFTFATSDKVSNPLLMLRNADCGYADKTILAGVNLTLTPGSRIGLLGPNGAGKSTLIKTLVNDLALQNGERFGGEHLRIGYFAQHQLEALDMDASPALHIQRIAPKATDQEIRNYLGSFGFMGDDALDPVGRFSGGEKARVALALIAWQKPNLLLLDEPTNHLDLEVRHALTMAMQAFEGAVILVSHDRHLVRNTVDEFLLVNDGKVTPFNGDLEDYHRWLGEQRRASVSQDSDQTREQSSDAPKQTSASDRKAQKQREAEIRKQLSPLKKQITKLDTQMERLQSELSEIETALGDSSLYEASNKDTLKARLAEQAEKKSQLEEVEMEWMELSESLESLEASLTAE
jgi:ATP-binding cassette subfamily F protein 3